jgi:peptide methionine sulfoxide reductase msrA/msrB
MKSIYLAGGCFWGVEHFFSLINGVKICTTGYANGNISNPSYEEVCSTKYFFAETVKIDFDESVIDLNKVLDKFFLIIDPTSVDQQGGDKGLQYRTGIFYEDNLDRIVANKKILELEEKYTSPIVVEVEPLKNFYKAEEYHQDYLSKNPNGYCHIPLNLFKKAND